jgi:alpha-beta hydrolase superfamily lysophospholipase
MKILLNAARFVVILVFGLLAVNAHAAGFRTIEVPADTDHPAIAGAMWYPCSDPPGEIDLGAIALTGTKDCPIQGGHLPLVVISHGNLGAFFDHHDTAAALADAGFVIAAINHRGDNLPTLADAADPSVMFERPFAITRLIDFMLSTSPAASHIDRKRIGFFGFSAGALTGLELAGADPYWAVLLCRFSPAIRAWPARSDKTSGCGRMRWSRASGQPSWPIRPGCGWSPTAFPRSASRSSYGHPKTADAVSRALRLRPRVWPLSRNVFQSRTNIMWCRTQGISRSCCAAPR